MYVYAFGSNFYSQLAHTSDIEETSTPIEIQSLRGKNITKVACGFFHTLLLIHNKVYSFGKNNYLALGRDNAQHEVLEVPLDDIIVDISCGKNHSVALNINGDVYVWGYMNNKGKTNLKIPKFFMHKEPLKIAQDIISIQSTNNSIVMIDKHGDIKIFGFDPLKHELCNEYHGASYMLRTFLQHNNNLPIFETIKVGNEHCFVIGGNKLYGWGDNTYGQLGIGRKEVMADIQLIGISDVKDCAGGEAQTLFLLKDGSLYISGNNTCNSLTKGFTDEEYLKPNKIMDDIEMIACYSRVNFAVKKNAIYSWGESNHGELGHRDKIIKKPKKIKFKFGKILGIYPGLCHTIVVTEDKYKNKYFCI